MSMKSPTTRRERPRQIETSIEPLPGADCSWATDGLLLGAVSPASFSPPRRRVSPSALSFSAMPLVNFYQNDDRVGERSRGRRLRERRLKGAGAVEYDFEGRRIVRLDADYNAMRLAGASAGAGNA